MWRTAGGGVKGARRALAKPLTPAGSQTPLPGLSCGKSRLPVVSVDQIRHSPLCTFLGAMRRLDNKCTSDSTLSRLADHQDVAALATRALANGGRQVSPFRTEWDIGARCASPVDREVHGRTEGREIIVGPSQEGKSNLVALRVRCRRCSACLRYRASLWRVRATNELVGSRRTWMGTLTLSPEWHHQFLTRARVRWHSRGNGDLDKEGSGVQFSERHRAIGVEITKMVKRLREAHKGNLRFLLVVEAHKSGLPHYHMLVHQMDDTTLKYDDLKRIWGFGFSKWKLAEPLAAAYVCKYLTKSSLARVRASLGYGGLGREAASAHVLERRPIGREIIDTSREGTKGPLF